MKTQTANISIIAITLFTLINVSCSESFFYENYKCNTPENTGDGLETGTLSEINTDTNYLYNAVDAIQKGKHKEVHSMLIYKNNKLVFEEYFQGYKYQWDAPKFRGGQVYWNREMKHSTMSCTNYPLLIPRQTTLCFTEIPSCSTSPDGIRKIRDYLRVTVNFPSCPVCAGRRFISVYC